MENGRFILLSRDELPTTHPLADNREPPYVILMNGKLDQIGIFREAHRLEGGWRIVGWDPTVNQTFHAQDNFGAVILCNKWGTTFQAIEFNNKHVSHNHVPCVGITYATDPEGIECPTAYLRNVTCDIVDVSNELSVVFKNHLLNCVSYKGLND